MSSRNRFGSGFIKFLNLSAFHKGIQLNGGFPDLGLRIITNFDDEIIHR